MSAESFDFGQRLENIKADALRFMEDILEATAASGDGRVRRALSCWDANTKTTVSGPTKYDKGFACSLAISSSPWRGSVRSSEPKSVQVGGQIRAALRLEEYNVWNPEWGGGREISVVEALRIVKTGFDMMAQWVDSATPRPGEKLFRVDAP